jgi:hypothetical protein
VLYAVAAFRMAIKARRELVDRRKGHCRSRSTAAFSASCSLIVPANAPIRGKSEFRTNDVGRERRVSRVLCPSRDGDHLSGMPVARHL